MAVDAKEALNLLKAGNTKYVEAKQNDADVSQALRKDLCENGQFPHSVVITCSDSRVAPEHIFNCGLGEIFVIRVAGNVVTETQAASVLYASDHLKSKLVVVLGHTHCGAVGAAIEGGAHGCICALTDPIKAAIGDETEDVAACKLNVEANVKKLVENPEIAELIKNEGVKVIGAIYDIATGEVTYL